MPVENTPNIELAKAEELTRFADNDELYFQKSTLDRLSNKHTDALTAAALNAATHTQAIENHALINTLDVFGREVPAVEKEITFDQLSELELGSRIADEFRPTALGDEEIIPFDIPKFAPLPLTGKEKRSGFDLAA